MHLVVETCITTLTLAEKRLICIRARIYSCRKAFKINWALAPAAVSLKNVLDIRKSAILAVKILESNTG